MRPEPLRELPGIRRLRSQIGCSVCGVSDLHNLLSNLPRKKETRQGPLKLSAFPRRVKDLPPLPKGDSPPNTIPPCASCCENVPIAATFRTNGY
jgi:hypothetical protein